MPRPPRLPLKDEGPQSDLLIVEGADDFHAFLSLCDHAKIRGKCRIEDGGGYEAIRDALDTRIDESGLERIGFVVDADENIADRWKSLRNVLTELCGYTNVPDEPEISGTIIQQEGKVTVGLWLMPDNTLPGALEEFIRLLIPAEDALWEHARASVSGIPKKPEPLTDNWINKANIHTWLAWQEEPGKPIGQAITKRYLNSEAEQAQVLISWMKRLFKLEEVR